MYDSSFICTYKESDSDDKYREELLKAFKLDKPDYQTMVSVLATIAPHLSLHLKPVYQKMRTETTVLSHFLLSFPNQLTEENLLIALCSSNTFSCLHSVLRDINDGKIPKESVSLLMECLQPTSC